MKTSTRGLRFLERQEGSVRHAYNDAVNACTVGVGHKLHDGPCTAADYQRYQNLTDAQIAAILAKDVERFEEAINSHVRVPLHQCEFDALVSFAFNIGTGGFEQSSLLRAINAGNRSAITYDFELWRMAGGRPILLHRRYLESRLFLLGDYNDGGPWAKDPPVPPSPHPSDEIPQPVPDWAWVWAEWYLGRGPYQGHQRDPRLRPKAAPYPALPWMWKFLDKHWGAKTYAAGGHFATERPTLLRTED